MTKPTPTRELLDRLDDAGVPKGVIAKKIVVAPSAVSELYSGKRQLKYDEGMVLEALLPKMPAGRELPLIGMAGAGNWLEAIETTTERTWVPDEAAAEGRFVVLVVGQSMNLLLPEGSRAVVDPQDRQVYVGRLYLLRNADGEATIKRYRADPARFEPVSDDTSFVPFELGAMDFQVIGRVIYGIQQF